MAGSGSSTSSLQSAQGSDADPLTFTEWTRFLQDYSKGSDSGHRPPQPPPREPRDSHATPPLPPFDAPIYPSGEISGATARTISDFYERYQFLPPPRADNETICRQTTEAYNLFRSDQAGNFHRTTALARAIFPFVPVCTISLFQKDVQVVVSKAGEFPIGEGGARESSLCAHAALKKNGEITEILQSENDCGNGGVQGYIGVPITLQVDPFNPASSERVTVGVIALMSNQPFKKFSDAQRLILQELSSMLEMQLRTTFQAWRGKKEQRMRSAVGLLLEKALVEPRQQDLSDAAAKPPVLGFDPHSSWSSNADVTKLSNPALFAGAAEQMREILEADFSIIIDLSSFHATQVLLELGHFLGAHSQQVAGSTSRRSHHSMMKQDSQTETRLSARILASSSTPALKDLERNFAQATLPIAAFLDLFLTTGYSVFPAHWGLSGLEPLLSVSPTSITPPGDRDNSMSHIALPFYSDGQPNLLIVVASTAPFLTFSQDLDFVRNVGLILVARIGQNAVIAANAVKTGDIRLPNEMRCFFCSSVHMLIGLISTHELRTPLHGLLGQLDLLRDRFSNGEFSMVPTFLDSAEYCGAALRDIVDDLFELGQMARKSPEGTDAMAMIQPETRTKLVDLLQVTVEDARTCWMRWLQGQAVTAPASAEKIQQPVEIVLEYEDRSMLKNWWVYLDVAGFIRILNNLVMNSLKYTTEGVIMITLSSRRASNKAGKQERQIVLRCEDSGRGIAPEFLDTIFEPFTQADSFSQGAGLGLHITRSIVERMAGTIAAESRPGSGTIFTVVLPVDNLELAAPDAPRTMRRLVISSELTPVPSPRTLGRELTPPTPTPVDVSGSMPGAETSLTITASTGARHNEHEPHLTILVVDDNLICRKILVAILKRLNATAYQAEDGLAALEVFREVHPHVVWTDVSMPRMDGVTAAKEMRAIEQEKGWPPSHIVAITGLGMSDEHTRREGLASPAALDGWLIKGQTNMKSLGESLNALRRRLRAQPI